MTILPIAKVHTESTKLMGLSMQELRTILLESMKLKNLPRSGWVQNDIIDCESVAAHSWGVAWLATVLCPPELDAGKATQMAVLHDLAEVRIGDITPSDNVSKKEKYSLEYSAMTDILNQIPRSEHLLALWLDYEQQQTPESIFVKSCDKLDMALQAQYYMLEQGKNLNEFLDSALKGIDDETLSKLADANRY